MIRATPRTLFMAAAVLIAATATVAFALYDSPRASSQFTVLYKFGASDSGKATSSFDLIVDSPHSDGAYAIFRLTTTEPSTGMIMSVRRGLPLANVSWPVSLSLEKADGSVAATAVFSDPESSPSGELQITTSDG